MSIILQFIYSSCYLYYSALDFPLQVITKARFFFHSNSNFPKVKPLLTTKYDWPLQVLTKANEWYFLVNLKGHFRSILPSKVEFRCAFGDYLLRVFRFNCIIPLFLYF